MSSTAKQESVQELIKIKDAEIEKHRMVAAAAKSAADMAYTAKNNAEDHVRELQNGLEHMENLHKQALARSSILEKEIEEMLQENTQLSEQNERFIDEIRNLRSSEARIQVEIAREKGKIFHYYSMLEMLIIISKEMTPYCPEGVYKKYKRFLDWYAMQMEFAEKMYGLKMID
jgi:chromosome segregation ATPase